ncbi:EAL domain-containing protein, partial [Actinoplanes sp. NPDC051633]|uniref:putative bifunctional diguanylate cyclase/phosphodiesterase n=1 Tax=Actinoplanes sp. NPDC051633 TaxID=3155670 RepID=UPI0034302F22
MASDLRGALRPVAATGALVAGGTVWYVAYLLGAAGPAWPCFWLLPLGGTILVASIAHLLRAVTLPPAARRFWRTIQVSFGLIGLGYATFAWDVTRHSVGDRAPNIGPVPSALAAAGFIMTTWAVMAVPMDTAGRSRWRLLLDRSIAFTGCAVLLWHFGLAPMLTSDDPWSPSGISLVGLSFVLAATGVAKVSYVTGGPVDRTALRLIASVGFTAVAVSVLAVRMASTGDIPAQAVVMPMGPLLAAFAVRAQWRAAVTRPAESSRQSGALLPYLAVTAVVVAIVAVAITSLAWTELIVMLLCVVVGLLVTTRLYVGFRDNAQLLHEKHESEQRLQHEVTHDGLTGLANRALFRESLTAELGRRDVTVMIVDLDDFKTDNDSLGHEVGDRLLVSVAEVLTAAAGRDGVAARLSGDEFAVLVFGDADTAEGVARRMFDGFSRPLGVDRLLIAASVGFAPAARGTGLDTALRHADAAMYAAKQRGKAGYVRYAPGMEKPVLAHVQLGGELRRGLDEGEFRLHYQPIMRFTDRKVIGVEALVRWQHPERGLVPPIEFIPAAERTGLIVPLGRWVLREACREAAGWLAAYGPDALQKVGPNVSARQLHDPDFASDVRAALEDSGLPADRLVIEVTESEVLRGRQVLRTLRELDAMGVKLALDDFGTGESSLSLLRLFPAAIVKLDKSFVDGIEIDDGDPAAADARQAVARAVSQLAGALRLDTVAEGVENEQQVAKLC